MEIARNVSIVVKQPAVREQGLVLVYYGDGKGKTTAALGAVLRAAGQGEKSAVLQFIKGLWPSSERDAIPKHLGSLVTIEAIGEGFVGIQGDKLPREKHAAAARDALNRMEELISDQDIFLLVLDEILDTIELGLVSEQDVLDVLKKRRPGMHLILTGHKAIPGIMDAADLVTKMRKEKHPYDKGVLAIRGLDY